MLQNLKFDVSFDIQSDVVPFNSLTHHLNHPLLMTFTDNLIKFAKNDVDQKQNRDSAINHYQRLEYKFGVYKFHDFLNCKWIYERKYILNEI